MLRSPSSDDAPPDEPICSAVREALRQDPEIDASDVEVVSARGGVTLRGWVEDAAAQERARSVAARLAGGASVVDELRIRPPSGETGDFADERGPLATEFGTAEATRATRKVDNDDKFHGN